MNKNKYFIILKIEKNQISIGDTIRVLEIFKGQDLEIVSDKKYNIEDLDMGKYVQAILIKINDESYLLDQNNLLYKFNNNNEIVGTLIDDQVEWY